MKLIWLLFSQELLQQSFGIYSLGGRNSIKFLPHLSGGFLRRQLLNTIAVHGFWFSVIECSKFRTLPTGTWHYAGIQEKMVASVGVRIVKNIVLASYWVLCLLFNFSLVVRTSRKESIYQNFFTIALMLSFDLACRKSKWFEDIKKPRFDSPLWSVIWIAQHKMVLVALLYYQLAVFSLLAV
jgi:PiT family inorganic phosphate transporter